MRLVQLLILSFFFSCIGHSQKIVIEGYIKDLSNREAIIDAVLQINDTYTITNAFGYFSLSISPMVDSITINLSHVGYEAQSHRLKLSNDTVFHWYMEAHHLQTLTVIAQHRFKNRKDQMAGSQTIESSDLSESTLLVGENDIVKYLALQSGVGGGVEGYSDITVRGGGLYENQYFLDGIPMYNTGHLLGLTSIFNGNIIKKADFYKGHTPSQYGGRLSSYTAIETKSGNSKEWEFNGDLGFIESDASIEGPLFKNKNSSMILSSRVFYIYPLVKELKKEQNGSNYYFYDVNLKVHHEFNENSKLDIAYFYGKDYFAIDDNLKDFNGNIFELSTSNQNINNAVLSLRYAHAIDKNNFFTWHLGHTSNSADITMKDGFIFKNEADTREDYFNAELQDFNSRINIDRLLPNNFRWISGLETNVHRIKPGILKTSIVNIFGKDNNQYDSVNENPLVHLTEMSLYSNIDGKLLPQLRFQGGLRLSSAISDKSFLRLEPRLGLSYEWKNTTFKASANVHHQYLHPLVFGDSEFQPLTVWLPTDKDKKPQQSQVFSLGFVRNIFNKNVLISVDGYYKNYQHLVDARNTTRNFNLFFDPDSYLAFDGKGRAYGIETTTEAYIGKKIKLNLIYTWSKSFRQFKEINQGNEYPFKFQREHVMVFNAFYRISEKWKATCNFIFNSGHRFTYPPSLLSNSNLVRSVYFYSTRNNVELQPYHRLDLGFQWKKPINEEFWFGINFGIYNIYSKKNPVSAYPETTGMNDDRIIVRGENIIQALPYINFKIKQIL